MPYLRGKLKGQLKPPEIRKIIRLHNELSKVKIPPRLDRDGLIKFVESQGYKIDHENEKIVDTNQKKETLTLKEAQEKFPVKPRKKKEAKKSEDKKETLQIEDKPKGLKRKMQKKKARNFKIERPERTKMINEASEDIGKRMNPFKILGIKASEETPELVKKKCRELRLKNHPDKGGDKDKFDLIQKACDILLSTQTKK